MDYDESKLHFGYDMKPIGRLMKWVQDYRFISDKALIALSEEVISVIRIDNGETM